MSWGLISEMGHVAIQTTDLEGSLFDATELLGLRVTERTDSEVYLAAAPVHHELTYVESDVNGIHSLGLVAKNGDALREIRRRVDAENFKVIASKPVSAGVQDGFSFIGPEGWIFEIYTDMQKVAPILPSGAARLHGDKPYGGLSQGPAFGPDRYGHINFHPRDVRGMMEFLRRIFDFRLSDVIGDDFAYFMRCNPDHHGIALIRGEGTFHHHAWQTQSIVDLGKLGDRLHAAGRDLIWGPVRHGAGHNIAAYFVETSGAVVELYTDLEQIYDDDREPVIWDAEDNWFNMWSPYRPLDFRNFGIPTVTNRG